MNALNLIKRCQYGFIATVLVLSVLFAPSPSAAADVPSAFKSGEFTSGDVLAQSLNLECLEYCLTGICVSLFCTPCPTGICCEIDTSPELTHFMPDFVVSAYNDPGEISWVEAGALLGTVTQAAAAGILGLLIDLPTYGGGHALDWKQESSETQRTERNSQMLYKEISVIGNPYVALLSELLEEINFGSAIGLGGNAPLCPSDVTAFYPYFQSEFDALTWRFGLPELLYPSTWIPGFREIGDWPLNTWGSVHPRQGFLTAIEEPKAAGVMAQRAIDVVTRTDQPHIYTAYTEGGESDENVDKWQMVSPIKDEICAPFGDPDYSIGEVLVPGDERTVSDGKFGWLFWNDYSCCPWKKGILLFVIPTSPVCFT